VHKKKTCYELMHGRTPKVSHFHVFGCKCFILKKGKKLDKFEARSVDRIFFGYASHSRAYRIFLFFNPFYSKILKLTSPQLKLQEVALLVAPNLVARLILESRHMMWRD
jgi:hypothetical protein